MGYGEIIRQKREEKGLTQSKLAAMLGVSRVSISHYENEDNSPTYENIKQLSQILDIPEQDLFDPSRRQEIAKEEVRKDPFRYLDEIEDAAMLKHAVTAEVMSVKAAAGTGNNIESIDVFTTGRKAVLDSIIFKAPPKGPVRLMQVDGYSMVPMLYPDSWVIYEDAIEYTVDGLYVINYSNELMVKLLQFNPEEDVLEIISKNPEYKSWKVRPGDQSTFQIVGKVVRCVI